MLATKARINQWMYKILQISTSSTKYIGIKLFAFLKDHGLQKLADAKYPIVQGTPGGDGDNVFTSVTEDAPKDFYTAEGKIYTAVPGTFFISRCTQAKYYY